MKIITNLIFRKQQYQGISPHHPRRLIPFLVCLPLLFSLPGFAEEGQDLSGAGANEIVDKLSFTNTQRWHSDFLKRAQQTPLLFPKNWRQLVAVPRPPANSSPRTGAELAYLKTLISKRPDQQNKIEAEVNLPNFTFGQHTYASLIDSSQRPATAKLIEVAFSESAIAIFVFKKEFNRVRPSVLAEKLQSPIGTAIAIPEHPAYPSGHSASAWTIAYLLQELDPENTESFHKSAAALAYHREVAGLHYPSDSEAGRLLARQLTDLLLANPHFQKQLEESKKEW